MGLGFRVHPCSISILSHIELLVGPSCQIHVLSVCHDPLSLSLSLSLYVYIHHDKNEHVGGPSLHCLLAFNGLLVMMYG